MSVLVVVALAMKLWAVSFVASLAAIALDHLTGRHL